MGTRTELQFPPLREPEIEDKIIDPTRPISKSNYNPMLGTTGSPVRINPWNFISSLGPKKQALAIAKDIDTQRGIQVDTSPISECRDTDTGQESSQLTVRRLPSGAKPPSNGHSIESTTPVKPESVALTNSNDESIQNVVGQSTPLTQGKLNKNSDLENVASKPTKKYIDDPYSEATRREVVEDVLQLRGEVDKLKEINMAQKHNQENMAAEVGKIKDSLNHKSIEICTLNETIKSKENQIKIRDQELKQLKQELAQKECENIEETRNVKNTIKEIERELRKADVKGQLQKDIDSIDENVSIKSMLSTLQNLLLTGLENMNKVFNEDIMAYKKRTTELETEFEHRISELQSKNSEKVMSLERELNKTNEMKLHFEEHNNERDKASKIYKEEISQQKNTITEMDKQADKLKKRVLEKDDLINELKREMAENKRSMETKLTESDNLINKLKKDIASAAETTEEAIRKYEKTQKLYNEEQKNHKLAKQNLNDSQSSLEDFKSFILELRLFNIQLGPIIDALYGKEGKSNSLEPLLKAKNKNIVGFYYRDQQNNYVELQYNLKTLEEQKKHLSDQIESEWKVSITEKEQLLSQISNELDKHKEKNAYLEKRVDELEGIIEDNGKQKEIMMNEKETLLETNASLLSEIESIRNSTMDKNEEKLNGILDRIKSFSDRISQLQEQFVLENNQQKEKNDLLITKEAELCNLRNLIQVQNGKIKEVESKYAEADRELQEEKKSFQRIQGDIRKKIDFEVAHKSRPDIDRSTYDALMIDKVDIIDMVELQNIVKNLILLLGIPFNKLTKKCPLVAIYLKYERPIFSFFANKLHYEIFNEPIDMKCFTNDAYDQYTKTHNMSTLVHPLESCLDNLYEKIVSKI